MPGSPVTIGCAVILTPGVAGPPDSGVIVTILQSHLTAGSMSLATAGSMCQMINSLSGVPYMLPIGNVGMSQSVTAGNHGLVRMGDKIPSGPGIMMILGPPAAPYVTDTGAP